MAHTNFKPQLENKPTCCSYVHPVMIALCHMNLCTHSIKEQTHWKSCDIKLRFSYTKLTTLILTPRSSPTFSLIKTLMPEPEWQTLSPQINLKWEKNIITNRFSMLNNKISYNWLNLQINPFKLKVKELFLICCVPHAGF